MKYIKVLTSNYNKYCGSFHEIKEKDNTDTIVNNVSIYIRFEALKAVNVKGFLSSGI